VAACAGVGQLAHHCVLFYLLAHHSFAQSVSRHWCSPGLIKFKFDLRLVPKEYPVVVTRTIPGEYEIAGT
jgi:hypothetical protein